MLIQSNNAFSAKLIEACKAEIQKGTFYDSEFQENVKQALGEPDCTPVLIDVYQIDGDDTNWGSKDRALFAEIKAKVKESPRGHYAIYHRTGSYPIFKGFISDGTGSLGGGEFDTYDSQPTGEILLDKMIGYEIYKCRKAIEQDNNTQDNIASIERNGFKVGAVFKNIKSERQFPKHTFSTLTINNVMNNGSLEVTGTKRGSKNVWKQTVSAVYLQEMIAWSVSDKVQAKSDINDTCVPLF